MDDHIEIIRKWASDTRRIQRVWIFGSRARGDHNPDSDLDVLVEAGPGDFIFDNKKWNNDLQHRLKPVKPHLVEYQEENLELAEQIRDEKILIYSKDNP